MRIKTVQSIFCITVLHLCLFVKAQSDTQRNNNVYSNRPTCDCDTLWKKQDVSEFTYLLEKVTSNTRPVWPGYSLSDATYIIDAGKTAKEEHCLGLWKGGKVLSYAKPRNTLQMLTSLYSYYLDYKGMDTIPDIGYFKTAQNAPEVRKWMKEMGVTSAVYMPLDFSKLPFKLPALVKVQLAVHEAFHVEVMMKYWYTGKGNWPKWDQQPDRNGVQLCYTYNDTGRVMIRKELFILADMMEALLDNNKGRAYTLGRKYIDARENRYKKLGEIKPKLANNADGDCRTVESLFELEEGLADYGSWTILYNMGVAAKEDLLKRYRAQQKDHFYLSGCMLMHAITLMSKESPERIINKVIKKKTVNEGSLFLLFEKELEKY